MLLGDHHFADRTLLVAPDHQRRPVYVGQEALRDIGLQTGDTSGVVVLRKAEELDVAAQELGPAEVLREPEERCCVVTASSARGWLLPYLSKKSMRRMLYRRLWRSNAAAARGSR